MENLIERAKKDGIYEKFLIDPFNGMEDIKLGLIRCVGSADRLNEDPLRMMRMIRFSCQLGFRMVDHITNPERLQIISRERVRDELSKILLSDNASSGIDKLCETNLMHYIIPEFYKLIELKQGKNHIKDAYGHTLLVVDNISKYNFGEDNLIARLTALLHDVGKPDTYSEENGEIHFYDHQIIGANMAERILTDLRFDNEIVKRVKTLIANHMSLLMLSDENINTRNIRRVIRRVGDENIDLILGLVKSDTRASSNQRLAKTELMGYYFQEVRKEKPCEMKAPLSGEEIMTILNIKPGKLVGEIKDFLLNKVIDGELRETDKETAEKLIKEKFL